jgi:outer membrane protein OmpA-like peptidoglycan-associated protein
MKSTLTEEAQMARWLGTLLLAICAALAFSHHAAAEPLAPAKTDGPVLIAPAAPPPAVPPAPFDEAFMNAAQALFSKAILPEGTEPIDLVIDPLIDGVSGAQSNATRLMEQRLVALVQKTYPRFRIRAFEGDVLKGSPVVLVGTFTAISSSGSAIGPKDAYRICLALADLRSKKIISKGFAIAKPDGVDATPTPAFAENPVWADDAATTAYIKTCQGTKPGDPLNPIFVERVGAAALISDAIAEYDSKHYRESLAFYRTARMSPGGDQLRVHNGVFLANWKLNRRDDAADSFARLIDFSLKTNKLAIRFLFKPGSTRFFEDEAISGPYSMWLKQIANRLVQSNMCLEIVGHTSPTGPAQLNERLSVLRAEAIRRQLETNEPRLSERLVATGVGARENLIGTGRDDASDALDRRVEFKILKCG